LPVTRSLTMGMVVPLLGLSDVGQASPLSAKKG
jgi:hypothetical protein